MMKGRKKGMTRQKISKRKETKNDTRMNLNEKDEKKRRNGGKKERGRRKGEERKMTQQEK